MRDDFVTRNKHDSDYCTKVYREVRQQHTDETEQYQMTTSNVSQS